ncbi:MAG: hypothetical protein V4447_10810 [Pseudomonadota bacterium]
MTKNPELITDPPTWLPADAWAGYLEMRKSIKKTPTERATLLVQKKLLGMLHAGQNIEAVLDQSTVNNWTDVYPVKNYEKLNAAAQGMNKAAAATLQNLQDFLGNSHE